jgi:hypothetical protein
MVTPGAPQAKYDPALFPFTHFEPTQQVRPAHESLAGGHAPPSTISREVLG